MSKIIYSLLSILILSGLTHATDRFSFGGISTGMPISKVNNSYGNPSREDNTPFDMFHLPSYNKGGNCPEDNNLYYEFKGMFIKICHENKLVSDYQFKGEMSEETIDKIIRN